MADKLKKVSKAHTRYYLADGTLVPGSTTVTGLLNKPALVKWANNLGLQGIDSTKYVDKAARVGRDYDFAPNTTSNVCYICGMSVPPVMMKRVVERIIESKIFEEKQ